MKLPNLPFWSQSNRMTVMHLPDSRNRLVNAKKGYWRLRLIEMRLGRDWIFTSILHPSMFIEYSAFGRNNQIVIGPKQFGQMRGDMRLVHLDPQIVIPPLPHTGVPYDLRAALVSVPGKDLAEGMLNMLTDLSDIVGDLSLSASVKLTNLLRQGVNTVIGLDECKMQLGWVGQIGQFDEIRQGYILVAPPNSEGWEENDVRVFNGHIQIRGQDIEKYNYLLFSLEVAERRLDWEELPEIKETLHKFRAMLGKNFFNEDYRNCVDALLSAVQSSPHLIENQKDEIISSLIRLKTKTEAQKSVLMRADIMSIDEKIVNDLNEDLLINNIGHSVFED